MNKYLEKLAGMVKNVKKVKDLLTGRTRDRAIKAVGRSSFNSNMGNMNNSLKGTSFNHVKGTAERPIKDHLSHMKSTSNSIQRTRKLTAIADKAHKATTTARTVAGIATGIGVGAALSKKKGKE